MQTKKLVFFSFRMRYVLALTWLIVTVALSLWWMYFGLVHLEHLSELVPDSQLELAKYRRMMIWEGAAWMILLLTGGVSLIFLLLKEDRRAKNFREFFAAFSHDIKTSLASLRLQAESLQEDLPEQRSPLLKRLISDTVRLDLQLQNSLFLSSEADMKCFLESIALNDLMESMAYQWPQIQWSIEGHGTVLGDRRALIVIFSNLTQNSILHGGANRVQIRIQSMNQKTEITFSDDGAGFSGDVSSLAKLFVRHNTASGSGVGLYISKVMIEKMGGTLAFESLGDRGFQVRISLPSQRQE